MGQINKVKGIINFNLKYGKGNLGFHKDVRDILQDNSYTDETYSSYLDKVENLKEIIGDNDPLLAVKSGDDYLIVKDLSGIDKEISVFIIWQSCEELAETFSSAIETINDHISEKWRKGSKLLKFHSSPQSKILVYPAYHNGYKVESEISSTIQNISVVKVNKVNKPEMGFNFLGVILGIITLIVTRSWEAFWGIVIPMLPVVGYNIWEWFQKDYKLKIDSFNIIEHPDDTKGITSPPKVDYIIPEINLQGDEDA